ncbi:MAG: DNA-deoxyinosine glycosylase [Sporolactobacillus sp.]
MDETFIFSLAPIIDSESRVLILGSMPSRISLAKQQYYGNPRNHFWRLLFQIFDEPLEADYTKKTAFLLKHHLALWDVIHFCRREGSLDSAIHDEAVNAIPQLLQRYPNVRLIAFNGRKAQDVFRKRTGQMNDLPMILLPSSSPMPGRNVKSYDQKFEIWKMLKTAAEEDSCDHFM